jgi:hypothetical protein
MSARSMGVYLIPELSLSDREILGLTVIVGVPDG